MRRWAALAMALALCSACGVTPDADPDASRFRAADYQAWFVARDPTPPELIGLWRLSDASLKESETAFRFEEGGTFASGAEADLIVEDETAVPEWQGAFRIDGDKIICHYQIFQGSREWSAPDGRGQLAVYPFVLRDADSLELGGQTRMKLIMKFLRVR